MKQHSVHQIRPGNSVIVLLLVAASIAGGCQRQESSVANSNAAADSAPAPEILPDYAVPVTALPREVAEMALKAINANELKGLQQLLATKKIQQDVQAITRGNSKFAGMATRAVPMAAATIASEIKGLDPDARAIDQETITGETALVTVSGMRQGQPMTRRFFLVREDAAWKLVTSHR